MSKKVDEILDRNIRIANDMQCLCGVYQEQLKHELCEALQDELPPDRTLNKAARDVSTIYKKVIIEFFGQGE